MHDGPTVETKPVAVAGGGDKAGTMQIVMEWRFAQVAYKHEVLII